ncbi:MAG: hypothetical protein ACM3US_07085 [Sphingomonadaceae bacterium]
MSATSHLPFASWAITSRTGFCLSVFRKRREEIRIEGARASVVDLEYCVLGTAMVETAAYRQERLGEVTGCRRNRRYRYSPHLALFEEPEREVPEPAQTQSAEGDS